MRQDLLLFLLLPMALAAPARAEESADPVLLELFTSQGCISCPPADDLLGELGKRPDVVALSLHVDYWNSLGWIDPFSAASYTERQRRYVREFKAQSPYTPMLVAGGQGHCVGSQVPEVEALIEQARKTPRIGHIQLTPKIEQGKLQLELAVDLSAATEKKLDLMVAIAEKNLETAVGRGENASRKLKNQHVVRRLEKVAAVPKTPGASSYRFEVKLDKDWKKENLEAVAFLQNPDTLKIEGAARVTLP